MPIRCYSGIAVAPLVLALRGEFGQVPARRGGSHRSSTVLLGTAERATPRRRQSNSCPAGQGRRSAPSVPSTASPVAAGSSIAGSEQEVAGPERDLAGELDLDLGCRVR